MGGPARDHAAHNPAGHGTKARLFVIVSPPAWRKKRMFCAKSPLPQQAACCLCEGEPIQPHRLADAVWPQLSQMPQSPDSTSSAVYPSFRAPLIRCLASPKPIQSLNCRRLIIVCVLASMLSHAVPLSSTGVKYPNVRGQGRSSKASHTSQTLSIASNSNTENTKSNRKPPQHHHLLNARIYHSWAKTPDVQILSDQGLQAQRCKSSILGTPTVFVI